MAPGALFFPLLYLFAAFSAFGRGFPRLSPGSSAGQLFFANRSSIWNVPIRDCIIAA